MTFSSFMKQLARVLLKPLSFIPALLIMYMIYSFSAQDSVQSSALSSSVTYKAVITIDRFFDMQLTQAQTSRVVAKAEHYVRKLAHFGEYFLLAVSIALPFYVYGLRGILLVLVAGIICSGYAFFDEFHQLFVSGRSASYKDVLIDSCGALCGIIFVRIFGFIGRHTIFYSLHKS